MANYYSCTSGLSLWNDLTLNAGCHQALDYGGDNNDSNKRSSYSF